MVSIGFFSFFSSRRRHTRFDCDWSSDVFYSDLEIRHGSSRWTPTETWCTFGTTKSGFEKAGPRPRNVSGPSELPRAEVRRIGKECRSRWWPYHEKKKKEENDSIYVADE